MKQFEKKYQVWQASPDQPGYWVPTECDTLQECIETPKQGDWYVTKRAVLSISDAEETPLPTIIPSTYVAGLPTQPSISRTETVADEDTGDEEATARYLAGGPIAPLTESGSA